MEAPHSHGSRVVVDRPCDVEGYGSMEFVLTYEGPLKPAKRGSTVENKHDIRLALHPQLRRLWLLYPHLESRSEHRYGLESIQLAYQDTTSTPSTMSARLARRFDRCGVGYVPLVTEEADLVCSIDVLFLKSQGPGNLIYRSDIDNRLKVLFDGLRVPNNGSEITPGWEPKEDENPLYCLLQEDSLITHLSVTTESLLEPLKGKSVIDDDDARLFLKVSLRPRRMTWASVAFA